MRESIIENYLVKFIKSYGGLCLKFSSPARRSVPDRICLLSNNAGLALSFFFVECKATGQVASPAQEREHKRLRDLGYTVFVVDSKAQVSALKHDIEGPAWYLKKSLH